MVDAAIALVDNNDLREEWLQSLRVCGVRLAMVVHPIASVSASAELYAGSPVMALAIVGVDALIGNGTIFNAHST